MFRSYYIITVKDLIIQSNMNVQILIASKLFWKHFEARFVYFAKDFIPRRLRIINTSNCNIDNN